MSDDGETLSRLGELEREVAGMSVQLKAINESLGLLTGRINRPTNWIGLGGFAVVFFGSMVSFVGLNLKPIEATIGTLRSEIEESRQLIVLHQKDGHPHRVEDKVADNERRIEQMDVTMQREMRILDEILQRDIKLNREIVEQRLKAAEQAILDIDKHGSRKWMDSKVQPGELR